MMDSPYRENAYAEFTPYVQQQMADSVHLLKKFKRYDPVISGGALWSWAANKQARDVDIFLPEGFWVRRKVRKMCGNPFGEQLGDVSAPISTYVMGSKPADVERFVTAIAFGTPVDIVLTPWRGTRVALFFDYLHCAVAFGLKSYLTVGTDSYQKGKLQKTHERARSEEKVMAKVQPSLWGNPNAGFALLRVIRFLERQAHGYGYTDLIPT